MNFYTLSIISLALSLDAFGVALSIGLNRSIRAKHKIIFSLSFGFFQFLLAFIGAFLGVWFTKYITVLPNVIGGIIVSLIGLLMVKEGMEEKEECILFKPRMYIVLGVSVSIDALVVGFSAFNNSNNNVDILLCTLFIGAVSFFMTGLSFIISKYLNKIAIISRYADYIGGMILILFGIRMMFFC